MDPLKEQDIRPNREVGQDGIVNIDDLPSLSFEDIEKGVIDKTVIQGWFGNKIRFIEVDGIWYAVLKDICDALNLDNTTMVSQRINPNNLIKGRVANKDVTGVEFRSDKHQNQVENGSDGQEQTSIELRSALPGRRATQYMLLVDEAGIYQALFESRKLEARKFVQWTTGVLCKLREKIGLKPYECVRMTDQDIQDDIDFILDTLYWDDEKKCVMQSVTVPGGDVEQVVFSK